MTSILYRSNQEIKSSASECGVTRLDDYHIRLICCSQAWLDDYDLEPIQVNGLWVPGLGQLILNAPYLVIDTTCFLHMRIQSSIVWGQLRSQVTHSFLLWAPDGSYPLLVFMGSCFHRRQGHRVGSLCILHNLSKLTGLH